MARLLQQILSQDQDALVKEWAQAQQRLYGTGYAERSATELEQDCNECLTGLIELFSSGSRRKLRTFVDRTTRFRTSLGFNLSELHKAVLMFRDLVRPLLQREYAKSPKALLEATDTISRALDGVVFDISDVYQQITNAKLSGYAQRIDLINDQLEDLNLTDPLTGCYNHCYLQEHLRQEVDRSQRYKVPVSVVLLDVDGFRDVNARFGYIWGDQLLKQVAHRLRETLRDVDILSRFGGEEFAVVLPETPRKGAWEVANKLHASVSANPFQGPDDAPISLTISCGVASFPDDRDSAPALLDAAAEALSQVQQEGGDAVSAVRNGGKSAH